MTLRRAGSGYEKGEDPQKRGTMQLPPIQNRVLEWVCGRRSINHDPAALGDTTDESWCSNSPPAAEFWTTTIPHVQLSDQTRGLMRLCPCGRLQDVQMVIHLGTYMQKG
ncbi:hypothetical protein T310_2520 [Rasamsonia emersonii CBS 393.64]|uniref:Uncharacterized protein n=1 Tax=Rasamsonia emersonii (strain ATCC 16479 / CBS 393.64 / IMI 116815) TaxID=1408163 RepID=A0A0F4YYY2_RASE3|nr:hypothetical protein T310_2520 [Rasamsonia emersonii CBS 393.64]KKA23454.1 hypothetical protein T310_2520 [Rasamsonia emersonii CBS 393.64]